MILTLVSPEKVLLEKEVASVTLPAILGEMTILENHAPLISGLKKGKIKIVDKEGKEFFYEIERGVVEVSENKVTVLITF